MDFINNLDLLSVATAIAGIGVLGFSLFFSNKDSVTNRTFFAFAIWAVIWSTLNYFSYRITYTYIGLVVIKLVLVAALWMVFNLFKLLFYFPDKSASGNSKRVFILSLYVTVVSIITFSSATITKVTSLKPDGTIATFNTGPGIIIFGISVFTLIVSGMIIFLRKTIQVKGAERKQYIYVLIGFFSTFLLLFIFNFIAPAVFNNSAYVPYGALFILPLIICTFYAIRFGLLNIKIAATALLVFVLSIVTFIEVIFADSLESVILRVSVFTLVLIFGISLIRGVHKEVEQREKIEELATKLEKTNKDLEFANNHLKELDQLKSEFVSMATHQLRSPLTAIKGYISLIEEGDYGPVSKKVKEALDVVYQSTQNLVNIVGDFLDVSRIELGKMKYEFTNFNMEKLVSQVVTELKPSVDKAGLNLTYTANPLENFEISADIGKIKQVVGNLIDNAIKYTPQGSIGVSLSRSEEKIIFKVTDTGVGMPKDLIPQLFNKFSRLKDASKANILGTGLGLYVVKQMVEAHHGRVWAESDGLGKGSSFYVELKAKG